MNRVVKFLKEAETYYLATVEGDHLYRICTQQMMEIPRYSILKMQQQHFHHSLMNQK